MFRIKSKPIRTVLVWQVVVTVVVSLVSGWLGGPHGAVSAALGGLVSLAAGLGFTVVVQRSRDKSVGGTLVTALQAELVKIGLSVGLLWMVLTTYEHVVALACIGSFILTIVIFSMAFFVRDNGNR